MQTKIDNYDKGDTRTIYEMEDYYFGSIPAIYSVLTAEDIGIKRSSLERVGLSKGGVVLNKKACIRAGELIRSKVTK